MLVVSPHRGCFTFGVVATASPARLWLSAGACGALALLMLPVAVAAEQRAAEMKYEIPVADPDGRWRAGRATGRRIARQLLHTAAGQHDPSGSREPKGQNSP